MTKKEIARKVWCGFSWVWLIYITVKFFLGTASTSDIVCMVICYSLYGLILISEIALKIIQKVNDYKTYKSLVNGFEYLKAVHNARYKLYFTGDREKVEKYSAEIERYGNAILDFGKAAISSNLLSEKHIKSIEEIIRQTENLMTTN